MGCLRGDRDRTRRGVHGGRRHGEPVRAQWGGQRQSARYRGGVGLYGFTQMAYGALCTIVVEVWRPGSVFTVAVVLLGSAVLGQVALSLAVRRV